MNNNPDISTTPANSPNQPANPVQPPPPPRKRNNLKYMLIILGLVFIFIALFISYQAFSYLSINNTWKGIKPGKTTKSEVINNLGAPQEEINMPFSKGMIYDSGNETFPNIVIYDEEKNLVEGMLIAVTTQQEANKYYQEMKRLGKPEKVMHNSYLAFSKIFIFPQKGITYSANDQTQRVDAIHYYIPQPLNDYLKTYGIFFKEESWFIL